MRQNIIVCTAMSLALGVVPVAFAQDHDRDGRDTKPSGSQSREPDRGGASQRAARHGYSRHDTDRRSYDEPQGGGSRSWMGNYGNAGREDEFHYGARGPEWRRGEHVPPLYRSHQYVVNDWRAHHLSPPPRGYEWVQVGPDYVLVAIGTGIIAQVLLSNP